MVTTAVTTATATVRVVVCGGMPLHRGLLCAQLAAFPGLDVVADGADSQLASLIALGAEVLVLERSAGTPVAALAQLPGTTRLVVLTTVSQGRAVREALALHPRGIVGLESHPQVLATAIETVTAGEAFVDPRCSAALVQSASNPLSARETDVLRLAAQGLPVPEIAQQLYLSAGTVRNYLLAVRRKLRARTKVEAIRRAQEAGWL